MHVFSCSHTVNKYWYSSRSNGCDQIVLNLVSNSLVLLLPSNRLEDAQIFFSGGLYFCIFLMYAWDCSKWDLLSFSSHQFFSHPETFLIEVVSNAFKGKSWPVVVEKNSGCLATEISELKKKTKWSAFLINFGLTPRSITSSGTRCFFTKFRLQFALLKRKPGGKIQNLSNWPC